MTPLDWGVLSVYLVVILAVGAWAGRGNRALDDFFLAGREMRWWAVGLSVMATQISAITFIGTTGQAYTDGMRFLVVYFGLPFAMVLLCLTLVPFFYRARVFTAYEYLERRFDVRTRTFTSLLFLMGRGLAMGITLYAPSLVMSVILGWSESATILLMGGSTIAYVLYGGSRSVIWTDVIQMGIIWIGIFVCLGVAIVQLPAAFSLRDALALAQASGRLHVMNLDPRLDTPYTLWSGLLGGLFLALAYFGTDQSQVQRYLAGSSLTQSRLSLLFNAFLKIPMQFLILLTGVLVFVFYHFQPAPLLWNASALARLRAATSTVEVQALETRLRAAEAQRAASAQAFADARHADRAPDTAAYLASQARLETVRGEARARLRTVNGGAAYNDTNYIFPTYVLTHVPKGLAGLVIAVIFAAAMSTLSGEFNSVATATMIDFYKRFVRSGGSDAHDLLVSRLITAAWGVFACLVALHAGALGSAIEAVNRIGSLVYGPILGVFMVAVLFRKANGDDALFGLVCGELVVVSVALFTNVHFLWHNVVGAVSVLACAALWHVLSGGRLRGAPVA